MDLSYWYILSVLSGTIGFGAFLYHFLEKRKHKRATEEAMYELFGRNMEASDDLEIAFNNDILSVDIPAKKD